MRRGGGKAKGSAYERSVARQLSRWLTAGEDKTQLIRSVSSGGWSRRRSGEEPWRQLGDLAPNGPLGERFRRRWAVECKNHATVDLWKLLSVARPPLWRWWTKLQQEISEAGCEGTIYPMLVVKARFRPEVVVVSTNNLAARESVGDLDAGRTFAWHGLILIPSAVVWAQSPLGWMAP